MEINVQIEDRRDSAWLKLFRIILVVSLVAYSFKYGYDLGQEDMLNFMSVPEVGPGSQNEVFTSL